MRNLSKNGNMLKVQLRNGFSDRNGLNKINTEMQIDSLDDRARISLLNVTSIFLSKNNSRNHILQNYDDINQQFYKLLL